MENLCEEYFYNITLMEDFENDSLKQIEYPGDTNFWNEPDATGYIKLFAYAVIIIGGLFGNISVILTVALNRSMRTTINRYIANLAVADAMICVICMVPHALTVLTGNIFVLGEFMCKFNPFTQMTCLTCSVLTLCAISCDRFMAIMFPLLVRVTKQRTSIVMTVIWIISIAVSIPMLILKKHKVIEWKNFEVPVCLDKSPPSYYYDYSTGDCLSYEPMKYFYYIVMSVTLFFLPVVIMITAYSLIIWRLWKTEIPGEQNEANVNAHSKSRKKVIKMVFSVLIAFVICWTPLQFVLLFELFKLPNTFSEFDWFSYYIAYANSFINPIIYGGFNKTFRDGFCILLQCGCCKSDSGRLARWRSTISTRLTVFAPQSSTKMMINSRRVTSPKLNP